MVQKLLEISYSMPLLLLLLPVTFFDLNFSSSLWHFLLQLGYAAFPIYWLVWGYKEANNQDIPSLFLLSTACLHPTSPLSLHTKRSANILSG